MMMMMMIQLDRHNGDLNVLVGKTLCPPHTRSQLLQFLNQPPKVRTPTSNSNGNGASNGGRNGGGGVGGFGSSHTNSSSLVGFGGAGGRKTSIRKGSKVGHQLIRMLQQDVQVPP